MFPPRPRLLIPLNGEMRIATSTFTAASENQAGSDSAIAYQLSPPATSTSGWAIGFAQLDFHRRHRHAKQSHKPHIISVITHGRADAPVTNSPARRLSLHAPVASPRATAGENAPHAPWHLRKPRCHAARARQCHGKSRPAGKN